MFFAIYPSGYLLGKGSHTPPKLSGRVPPGTRWPDITIRKLFDHHFSLCSKRPVTIKQDVYHARPLVEFMENRPVSSITQKEILAFCKSQKMSGMAQSIVRRRISLQRSVANFGKKKDTCLQPLRSVPFQKEEPEELPRRPSQNSMHSCASLPRISTRHPTWHLYGCPHRPERTLFPEMG